MRKPEKAQEQLYNNDNWTIRRRWLRIGMMTLGANAEFALFWAIVWSSANAIQIFLALLGAIVALFGTYVFGATWDDNSKRDHMARTFGRDRDYDGKGEDSERIPGELPTPNSEE